jgi:hypothetical protein
MEQIKTVDPGAVDIMCMESRITTTLHAEFKYDRQVLQLMPCVLGHMANLAKVNGLHDPPFEMLTRDP